MRIPVSPIPTGPVASPAPAVRIPVGANGERTAQAAQQLASTATSAALDAYGRGQQEIDDSMRSRDRTALAEYENAVLTATDEIKRGLNDGSIKFDEADTRLQDRFKELGGDYQPRFSERYATASGELQKKLQFNAGREVAAAADVARRGELLGNLATTIDALGKRAGRPGSDVGAITAEAAITLDTLGRQAGLREDQIVKQKQDFSDRAYYDHLTLRIIDAKENVQLLDKLAHELGNEGPYIDKIDPQRREALLNQVSGQKTHLLQQAEAAQARATRAAEVRLNQAGRAYEALTGLMDSGGVLDPAYVAQVSQQVAGTPYAAALGQAFKSHETTGGFSAQSLPAQASALAQLDAEIAAKGNNPQLAERRKQLATIRENTLRDAAADPMGAALRRGVIQALPAFDASSPQALTASLASRAQATATVSAWTGHPVSPLRADELAALQAGLDKAPTAVKLATFGALQSAMPPQSYLATMRQLAKDQPVVAALGALAAQGANTTEGRSVARLGFEGLELIKDKTFLLPQDKDGADTLIPAFAAIVGTGTFLDAEQSNMAYDLTKAIYAKLSQDAGDNSGELNDRRLEQAVNLATGGITEHADQKVIKPYGMADSTFEDRVQAQLRQLAADNKVPYSRIKDLPLAPTPDVSGEYFLLVGRDYLRKSGSAEPIRITVLKPGPIDPIRGTPRGTAR